MSDTPETVTVPEKPRRGRPRSSGVKAVSSQPAATKLATDAGGVPPSASPASPKLEPFPPAADSRVILSVDAITDAMRQAAKAGPRDIVDYEEIDSEVSMYDPSLPKTMKLNGEDVPANPDAMPGEVWATHKFKNYIQPVARDPFSKVFGGPMPDELFDHSGMYTIRGIPVVLIPKPLLDREDAAARERMAAKTRAIFETTPVAAAKQGGFVRTRAENEVVTPESMELSIAKRG